MSTMLDEPTQPPPAVRWSDRLAGAGREQIVLCRVEALRGSAPGVAHRR